jgi:serine protease AprX
MKFMHKLVSLIILLAFVCAVSGPAAGAQAAASQRIHPLLAQMAAQQPNQIVQVIVQKADDTARAEAEVERLGGKILLPLGIINAFVAQMPASAASQVSALSSVRWVSPDAAMQETACTKCINTANLANIYNKSIRNERVWNSSPYRQGSGIGVAVVDSGINWQTDLYTIMGANRVVANVRFNTDYNQTTFDNYGHGSHIAGIVGGNGRSSNGKYIGVAPLASIINVKVSNDDGSATASSVVAGLEWVLNNRDAYNIRVVNISFNSTVDESYHTSPLTAAVEILWFNKIVVVVSAGNNGTDILYPPANDPFVITVGAVDDKGTPAITDDVVASFSAYSNKNGSLSKPDLVAPGKNIISLMGNQNGNIPAGHPLNKVSNDYFRMSGTSVAAPMVAGAAALLLEDEPNLTPDQVKYRLMATANKTWAGYSALKAGAGYLDVFAAVTGTTTQSANTGVEASQLLWTGVKPVTWSSVGWNSVGWNSVGWNSVGWNSVGWNSVGWNSDYWGE